MPRVECPSSEQLLNCLNNSATGDDISAVSAHIAECAECQDRLAHITGEADALNGALGDTYAAEPELLQAMTALIRQPLVEPGRLLREYRLLDKLGEGGMGTVFRALHTRLDKIVAIKVLAGKWSRHPLALARFDREIRAVGKLHHPHIVEATDAGEENGIAFLVMEFVEGIDLHRFVQRHGPLTVADACEIGRQVAEGLQHAHQHGMIHRDIKPHNLMLTTTANGATVKILDLGLALLRDAEPIDTSTDDTLTDATRNSLTTAQEVFRTVAGGSYRSRANDNSSSCDGRGGYASDMVSPYHGFRIVREP